MNDTEKTLTLASWMKWMNGEVMSISDFDRLTYVFEHCQLAIDSNNQPAQIASLNRFRVALQKFLTPPQ